MSKEVAAAILTQVYVNALRPVLTGARSKEAVNPQAVDEIGQIYAAFHARLNLFQGWGERYAPKPGKPSE